MESFNAISGRPISWPMSTYRHVYKWSTAILTKSLGRLVIWQASGPILNRSDRSESIWPYTQEYSM